MEPEKVPEKLTPAVNYKILLLLLGLTIGFQLYVTSNPENEDTELIIAIISIINPLVASATSFFIARKYGGSEIFGKAYFALGLALAMIFLGEVSWYTYIYAFGIEDPFPSIADIFFFSFYPLAAMHIILNVRFFNAKILHHHKIWLVAIPVSILTVYSYLSLPSSDEDNFNFYYGMIFVASSSTVLSLSILGAIVFRGGALGIAWALLLFGILLLTFGDVWYFYLETYEAYNSGHPVELLWYAGYWVITYALYKHKKII